MHSRIFQISRNPIEEKNYYDEDRYYGGFVEQVADYVISSKKEDDLNWLGSACRNRGVEVDSTAGTITIVDKSKYFEPKYKAFKKALADLDEVPFEAFICPNFEMQMKMYKLENTYSEKYAFYADTDDSGMISFDELIREAKDGDVFYVGATFDYHY